MEQIEDKTGMTDRIVTHGYIRSLVVVTQDQNVTLDHRITGSECNTLDLREQNGVGTSQGRGCAPTCVVAFDCLFVLKMCGAICNCCSTAVPVYL